MKILKGLMRYPYKLYDAYIGIDDIELKKIGNVECCTPAHLQAILEKAISEGISQGLARYGINEYVPTTSVNVSVCEHLDEWIPCEEYLPDYDTDVLVCLEDGTIAMTHRTHNDYSKDKYDFLHKLICYDAMYWQMLPSTPFNIEPEHQLKDL